MNKKQKNVVEGAALFSLAITAGIATAQYRANIPMKSGKFDLVSGQKNQNGAGELKEPAQENGGRDKAAKGLMPGQSIAKNPYIVSKADQYSQAYMKVNIPLFTEGAVAGKDTITLQNVSKNWVLLSDSKSDTTHTLIYGYKMKLAGDNSSKLEAERAKTDSLFTAFKITDEAVTSTFVGTLDVYGMLTQSEKGDIKSAFQDAEFNSDLSEDVFMISYDLKGGTLEGQKYLYTKDDYGYTPPAPTKDKYTFTGWSPAKIAEGSNSDIVFSAGWVANKLGNILYNLNGGSLENQKTSYTVEDYGYTPPAPTKENYSFTGWTPARLADKSEGDVTFLASWKANKLGNITYNLSGGSVSGAKNSYTVEDYGYTPPKPTKDGHAFTSWSPAKLASGTKGDTAFTAGWKENTLTINFHSNGADSVSDVLDEKKFTLNTTDSVVFKYTQTYQDKSLAVHSCLQDRTANVSGQSKYGLADADRLKKTGYHLANGKNWRNKENGTLANASTNLETYTGADVADFLGVLSSFKKGDVTVDLIPEWAANTYTVKYNANNPSGTTVSGSTTNSTHSYDTAKNLTTNGFIVPNYSFVKWTTIANGTGTSYSNAASVKNLTATNNGTVNLYAQQKANTLGTIKYNLNGGSISNQKTSYTVEDYGYTPPTPTKANYTFVGWTPASIPAGNNGDITFTAKWTATKLGDIAYTLNGGALTGQKTAYTVEDYGYTPPTPTRKYYSFNGWTPASIANGTKGKVTFSAKWTANQLGKLTYNLNGGAITGQKTTYTADNFWLCTADTYKGKLYVYWLESCFHCKG